MKAYRRRTVTRCIRRGLLSIVAGIAAGCDTTPSAEISDPSQSITTEVTTYIDARPAAMIDGRAVTWGDLRDVLSEAAGMDALRDLVLDRGAAAMLTNRGLDVTEADADREESRLLRTLDEDADVATRLLKELRAREGLGPRRFRNLLWRNARLRALVRDQVVIDEPALLDLYDALYGPKRKARLMTMPDLRTAELALRRVRGGAPFGEVAAEFSTDSSAARGGLLEPVSQRDRSWPAAVRKAIWNLAAPGAVSDAIVIDTGFAILQYVGDVNGEDVSFDDVRADLIVRLRLQQERQLMDRLARRIIDQANLTVIDDSLRAAWLLEREALR